jgi:hypothetical protein
MYRLSNATVATKERGSKILDTLCSRYRKDVRDCEAQENPSGIIKNEPNFIRFNPAKLQFDRECPSRH